MEKIDARQSSIDPIESKIDQFIARNGRRPRVLISHIGTRREKQSLHQVAAIFGDRGFDVDIGPKCQSPHHVARMAVENDVHMVCLLCHPDQREQVRSDLIDALESHNSSDILVTFFGDDDRGIVPGHTSGAKFDPARLGSAAVDTGFFSFLNNLTEKN